MRDLLSDKTFRVVVVLYCMGVIVVAVMHVRTKNRIYFDLARLHEAVVALKVSSVQQVAMEQRITELEREVYGAPPAEKQPPQKQPTPSSSSGQWQVNRDGELRRRIKALEEWRYKTEGRNPH